MLAEGTVVRYRIHGFLFFCVLRPNGKPKNNDESIPLFSRLLEVAKKWLLLFLHTAQRREAKGEESVCSQTHFWKEQHF